MQYRTLIVGAVAFASSALAQTPAGKAGPLLLPRFDTSGSVVQREQLVAPDTAFVLLRIEPRGEFESSQAYRARMSATDFYPIGVRIVDATSLRFSYNADKQEMSASFVAFPSTTSAIPDGIMAASYRTSSGFFEATNGYGAKFQVERVRVRFLLLRPIPAAVFGVESVKAWPMLAPEAQAVKPFLVGILVALPAPPDSGDFIRRNGGAHAATVSSPVESVSCTESLSVTRLALWIYDSRSGSVLQKLDLTRGTASPFSRLRPSTATYLSPCLER